MGGAVGFLCLLMGEMQWKRGEKLYAMMCYILAALIYLSVFADIFHAH